jgi:hypothetical protein
MVRSVFLWLHGIWCANQKNKGGLGVLNMKIQNQGLLLKFLDKFYNKKDIPWVKLIWSTYYQN